MTKGVCEHHSRQKPGLRATGNPSLWWGLLGTMFPETRRHDITTDTEVPGQLTKSPGCPASHSITRQSDRLQAIHLFTELIKAQWAAAAEPGLWHLSQYLLLLATPQMPVVLQGVEADGLLK